MKRRNKPLSRIYRRRLFESRKRKQEQLDFQQLEGRQLLATYVVSNTLDSGAGSFRDAIVQANTNSGSDVIEFSIGGGGVQTISPTSVLPSITDRLTIDGTTQPGYSGTPLIELNGTSVVGDGLTLSASSTIRGLAINRFGGMGILVTAAGDTSTISDNYIGLDPTGNIARANATWGIIVAGASETDIFDNVVSANSQGGIAVIGSGASPTSIGENKIGTNAAGTADLGNTFSGIFVGTAAGFPTLGVTGSASNTYISANLISGNNASGIALSAAIDTTIVGNRIGTDETGLLRIGNTQTGIAVQNGSTGTIIGGTNSLDRNIVSGNFNDGILINGVGTTTTSVLGNYIGVGTDGSTIVTNTWHGVEIVGVPNNTIGGSTAGARNVIGGNSLSGISISGAGATGNTVVGNYIGLAGDGNTMVANTQYGISMTGGSGTVVGGFTATPGTGAGNVISGNTLTGVYINGSVNDFVRGNIIGLDATGQFDRGNNSYGVLISNGSPHLVGGDDDDDGSLDGVVQSRNVISGNDVLGVGLTGGPSNVTIQGNYVGTTLVGTSSIGNGTTISSAGIWVDSSYSVLIGGSTAGAGNVISGNLGNGIQSNQANIAGQTLTVQGNRIGVGADGVIAIPNLSEGIRITNQLPGSVLIGGSVAGAGNVISGNASHGIIFNAGAGGHTVSGNLIGTDISGTIDVGNGQNGITIASSSGYLIGGTSAAERNIISGNQGHGISLSNNTSNSIIGNYIGTSLNGLGDLGNNGRGISTVGSSNNIIGGTTVGHRNIIAGNNDVGITFSTLSNNNIVIGNYISIDATGDTLLTNGWSVSIANSSGNRIGGSAAGERNFVGQRILVTGSNLLNTTNNRIQGNTIGVGVSGASLGHNSSGVLLELKAFGNYVGTDSDGNNDANEGNLISGRSVGVIISNVGTDGNVVAGNLIGTNATGTAAIPNTAEGVIIFDNATGNIIGGTTTAARNIISGSASHGVYITGANGNTVLGNYIGTDVTGTIDLGNTGSGVYIENSANTTVGGSVASARNVISGNEGSGVVITGASSTVNVIVGNYIGTNAAGTGDLGNTLNGVQLIAGANANQVGGIAAGQRNVISGNDQNGIRIEGTGTNANLIQGNYIGTDVTGSIDRGNSIQGISVVFSATGNILGGDAAGAGNVVSGNNFDGINITFANGNFVRGNTIGLAVNGNTALGNSRWGVYLDSSSTTVGSTASRNIISGNGIGGVGIGSGTTLNLVIGNYIGTDITGTLDRGNVSHGVQILNAGTNTIGGTSAGAGNLISGNNGYGVQITGAGSTGNTVQGNYIGTNAAGTGAIPNDNGGVTVVSGASGTAIGGETAGMGNLISGNFQSGITIDASSLTTVQGNYIGVDATGTVALPNFFGVTITNASNNNLIGGSNPGARNVISGSLIPWDLTNPNANGISINGNSTLNRIQGNRIGTNAAGTAAIPNTGRGIYVIGNSNTMGSDDNGINDLTEGNLISGNGHEGVQFAGISNAFRGNLVGTDATGTYAISNALNGLFLGGSWSSIVGSGNPGGRNVFCGNAWSGIRIQGGGLNVVQGNYVGTSANGLSAIANGTGAISNTTGGILISGSGQNQIGGSGTGQGNVISGNLRANVHIQDNGGVGSVANKVQGNVIGLNALGQGVLGNGSQIGVLIGFTEDLSSISINNTIGSDGDGNLDAAESNVISGNSFGIQSRSSGNRIGHNRIGTNTGGMAARPNVVGIDSYGSSTVIANNVVSGNSQQGIAFRSTGVLNVAGQVESNYIGVGMDGTTAIANGTYGIEIQDTSVVIGGGIGKRNIISGNTLAGVRIFSTYVGNTFTTINGNYIGTDATGTIDVGNGGEGVRITSSSNTIGGPTAADRNIISGNQLDGIYSTGTGITIQGNWIGVGAAGTELGNTLSGIRLNATSNAIVIGNVVSGNDQRGVWLESNAHETTIQGNTIGLDPTGSTAVGNSFSGIDINDSNNVIVGIDGNGINDENEGNLISANLLDGIRVTNGTANVVAGNRIGANAAGNPAGNGLNGIQIVSGTGHVIGGSGLQQNTIAYNNQAGLRVLSNSTLVGANRYISNAILGVDLATAGVSLNVQGNPANRNFPVLTSAWIDGSELVIRGFADSGVTFDLYLSNPNITGFGEGNMQLVRLVEGSPQDLNATSGSYSNADLGGLNAVDGTVTSNRFEYRIAVPTGIQIGTRLTAIHIGTGAETQKVSEFGNAILVSDSPGIGQPGSSLKPVITLPTSKTIRQGETLRVEGSFVDTDSTEWVATVNFGNGTVVPLPISANRTFVFEYVYPLAGNYTVTVSVTDNSLATGTATMQAVVQNAVPQIDLNLVSVTTPVNEGQPVTVSGTFNDGLNTEAHVVTIQWDNGLTSTLNLAAGVKTFSANHTYSSRGPGSVAGSGVDLYRIQVSVADPVSSSVPTPLGLLIAEVRNVLPGGLSATFSPTAINAGQSVTISGGSFTDPGNQDLHRVQIDWGDGSPKTIVNLAQGARNFGGTPAFTHVYTTAPRFGSTYQAKIELVDLDQPQDIRTLTQNITVSRASVSNINLTLTPSTIGEDGTVVLAGTFTDADTTDGQLVTVNWGDGNATSFALAAGIAFFSGISHQYLDNPSGGNQYTIEVQIAEAFDVSVFAMASQIVTVNNLAPSLDNLVAVNAAGTALPVNEGDAVRLTGQIQDMGTLDRQTIDVNWGDGTTSLAVVDSFTRTFVATHRYEDNGLLTGQAFQITATITDNDGAFTIQSVNRAVINVAPVVAIVPSATNTNPSLILLQADVQDVLGDLPPSSFAWNAFVAGNQGATAQSGNGSSFEINRSSDPNAVWTISLQVNDGDGGVTLKTLQFLAGTGGNDTIVVNNATMASVTSGTLLVLGLGGNDTIDASDVSVTTSQLILDGGAGTDLLFGGAGNDIYYLRGGNDSANDLSAGFTPAVAARIDLGDDRYILSPNSTLTVIDRSGLNALDFGLADFGVTFSLALNNSTSLTSQDVDPTGASNTHFVRTQGTFNELAGSLYGDTLTAASDTTVSGGDGEDQLRALAGTSGATFSGGSDDDTLLATGVNISGLVFSGDEGADLLRNQGSVAGLTFGGGSDDDTLINEGTITGTLNFGGDDGADQLQNLAGKSIATLVFGGGSDDDLLINQGSLGTLSFGGDSGADELRNPGTITTLVFKGGADDDTLTNSGSVSTSLDFRGDDGFDVLNNSGSVAGLIFRGGADDDALYHNAGTLTGLDFRGDDGVDVLENRSTISSLLFTGGADDDSLTNFGGATVNGLTFNGDDGADSLLNAGGMTGTIIFIGGGDDDALYNLGTIAGLDFRGDEGADTLQNSNTLTGLTFRGGADGDELLNLTDAVISNLSFFGDDGADALQNAGQITGVTFHGGADGDELVNLVGGVLSGLTFNGDDGADTLGNAGQLLGTLVFHGGADDDTLINSGSMGSMTFNGGADDDALLNDTGAAMGGLNFGGDDGADLLLNRGTATTVGFTGGADDDVLINRGSATGLNFGGDTGADFLANYGSATTVVFTGGADDDTLVNASTGSISAINFGGDTGADLLVNEGLVTTITFTGGADDDALVNRSTVGTITFSGGGDDDVMLNSGANVGTIDFGGDDGADILQNTGAGTGAIIFRGDGGADVLINAGSNVASINFSGGADDDVLISRGTNTGGIVFNGDNTTTPNGADTMILHGSGNGTAAATVQFFGLGGKDALQNNAAGFASITFVGGTDDDVLQNIATGATNIDFQGDSGADILDNRGSSVSRILFAGGADDDILVNSGNNVSGITFNGGGDDDTLLNTGNGVVGINFGGDSGADVLINTGANVSTILFTGGGDDDVLLNGGLASSGIEFRGDAGNDRFIILTQGANSSSQTFFGDAGADVLVNYAIDVSGLTFHGGADDDVLQNFGYETSGIVFTGDAGQDLLVNSGSAVTGISFSGGADDDTLLNTGNDVVQIDFTGDDGADLLQNDGSGAGTISFTGDDGADIFVNNGQAVALIIFTGDDGTDILQNNGSGIGSINFTGGGDDDILQNNGSAVQIVFNGGGDDDTLLNNGDNVGSIVFTGDTGADSLANNGSSVASITFTGGGDSDVMRVSGSDIGNVIFVGGDGADSMIHDAASAVGSVVTFNGGLGNDLVAWLGTGAVTLNLFGEAGNDTVIVRGSGTLNLNGGSDDDYYLFQANPVATVTIIEVYSGLGDLSNDTLDFSAFSGGALNLDLRSIVAQSQSANLSVRLTDGQGIENVYGTQLGDTIFGNSRDNLISGAEYLEPVTGPVAGQRINAQWVLLGFDSATSVAEGEHVYTAGERNQIQASMESAYHGPNSVLTDPSTWWFNVRFTQNLADIPSGSSYVTIRFNDTPSSGRPGGEASEVDLGNLNLGGTAVVQVNGLLGGTLASADAKSISADTLEGSVKVGARKPTATSENFVALSAKIASHELGHLMGLRHYDTYGPIGFGINPTPGAAGYTPTYAGPAGAFEAIDHLLGSGASIGTDRFNDLRQLFFGEREAVKLAYANSNPADVNVNETTGSHNSIATAQTMTMATVTVPNTLATGLNSAKVFSVQAAGVLGAIGLNGSGISESDFYSFAGRRGELVNIELSSLSLRGNRNGVDLYVDSIIRVYDSLGNLVSWYGNDAVNDDEFESTDSVIIDLILPSDGTFYVEVDTFVRLSGSGSYQSAVDLRASLEAQATLTIAEQELLSRLQDSLDDSDIGTYQLFVYRFSHANPSDGVETVKGNGGTDIISGGPGDDFSTELDLGPAATADSGVAFVRNVTFTDRAASGWTVLADYGDGTGNLPVAVTLNGSGQPVLHLNHVFAANGTYNITVTLTNDTGAVTVRHLVVSVADVLPVVSIDSVLTAGGTTHVEGSAVTVTTSASDPSGASSTFQFLYQVFKNGSTTVFATVSGTGLNSFGFTPDDNGSYEIRVRVTDADGDVSTAMRTITVGNVAPVIGTFAVSATGNQGSAINFASSATDAGVNDTLTYLWNFGDGNTANTSNASHVYASSGTFTVTLTVTDNNGTATSLTQTISIANVGGPPTASNSTLYVVENSLNTTVVGFVTATNPAGGALAYSLTGGTGLSAFTINSATGEIRVANGSLLDYETNQSFTLEFTVTNSHGSATAIVTIQLLNQASITGAVFVDINSNGLMEANEPGIDGVTVQLLDQNGNAVLGANGQQITATTSSGGFYLLEDLNPGIYRIRELQPTGVTDGAEIVGSLGGSLVVNDTMQLTLVRTNAEHYNFAELGQQPTSGDTAGIGFWQNKHGQALITAGGTALVNWLNSNFSNVFGNTFSDGQGGDNGAEVAKFYKEQLFKKKAQHGSGPAKVDAQFMATALAAFFTSNNLAGNVASSYGFNVTQTGIGTRIINVGNNGAAFNVANGTTLTIMQLLLATNSMTDSPNCILGAARIYDLDGDGVISAYEASLRNMANCVYSQINEV